MLCTRTPSPIWTFAAEKPTTVHRQLHRSVTAIQTGDVSLSLSLSYEVTSIIANAIVLNIKAEMADVLIGINGLSCCRFNVFRDDMRLHDDIYNKTTSSLVRDRLRHRGDYHNTLLGWWVHQDKNKNKFLFNSCNARSYWIQRLRSRHSLTLIENNE